LYVNPSDQIGGTITPVPPDSNGWNCPGAGHSLNGLGVQPTKQEADIDISEQGFELRVLIHRFCLPTGSLGYESLQRER
jgi:hypothetical protein